MECGAGFAGAGDGIDDVGGLFLRGVHSRRCGYVKAVPVTAGGRGATLNWNYLKVKEIRLS